MRPERFRASCDEILMAEIGPNASGGSENPLGKTETGTRKVTSRPTAPNQSVMATPTCQRRRNLHGFRMKIDPNGTMPDTNASIHAGDIHALSVAFAAVTADAGAYFPLRSASLNCHG